MSDFFIIIFIQIFNMVIIRPTLTFIYIEPLLYIR